MRAFCFSGPHLVTVTRLVAPHRLKALMRGTPAPVTAVTREREFQRGDTGDGWNCRVPFPALRQALAI